MVERNAIRAALIAIQIYHSNRGPIVAGLFGYMWYENFSSQS